MLFREITSKFAGGCGTPPLPRVVETPPPTHAFHLMFQSERSRPFREMTSHFVGRTQFAPTSREQPKSRSAKLHQNLRAGVETRPYNGAPRRRPLHLFLSLRLSGNERKSLQSPSVTRFARATSLPEGGITGRRVVAPYARISVCPFRNSQQIPRRGQNSPNSGTLRREQAPALPHEIITTNPHLSS